MLPEPVKRHLRGEKERKYEYRGDVQKGICKTRVLKKKPVVLWLEFKQSSTPYSFSEDLAAGIKHHAQQPGNLSTVAPIVGGALILLLIVSVTLRAKRMRVEQ